MEVERKDGTTMTENPWSNLPWKKVEVDVNLKKSHDSDLGRGENEEVANAFFFGLEVIDVSKYNISTTTGLGAKVLKVENNTFHTSSNAEEKEGVSSFIDNGSCKEQGITRNKKRKVKNQKKTRKKRKVQVNCKLVEKEKNSLFDEIDCCDQSKESDSCSPSKVRVGWAKSCQSSIWLHPVLCRSLSKMKFLYPTPIQEATLPAALLGRRNIVGAAPTGSGKTLAYAIPILQYLLERVDSKTEIARGPQDLRAIIVCPTRELALQVSREIRAVCLEQINVGTIVGGFAEQKQKRILGQKPPIVVATPGRLWQLINSQEHPHLLNMSHLRFLVVDEADRMISHGNFPQLKLILSFLQSFDSIDSHNKEASALDANALKNFDTKNKKIKEVSKINVKVKEGKHTTTVSNEKKEPRQTFIYSATLTLPSALRTTNELIESSTNSKKHRTGMNSVEGAISEILERAGAVGLTKIIDLTTNHSENDVKLGEETSKLKRGVEIQSKNKAIRLPPGLSLKEMKCTKMGKDAYLYAFLATTQQGSSGPCLIFCNSIAGVKRVGKLLQILGLSVRLLHAQMTQKARLMSLESLNECSSRSIVVATDVAARGLDIASVATVVHYDVARAVDTFIHRAGRTARGLGEKAVGCSVSLVAPGREESDHLRICHEVLGLIDGSSNQKVFLNVSLDVHLLKAAKERTSLASKINSFEEIEAKRKYKNKWFTDAAKDADITLDDDLLDKSPTCSGTASRAVETHEVNQAKSRLQVLLSEPMRKQRFGKFLSSAGIVSTLQSGIW